MTHEEFLAAHRHWRDELTVAVALGLAKDLPDIGPRLERRVSASGIPYLALMED